MEESHAPKDALDHVDTISNTIFVLDFMEEAIMTHESFSSRSYVGMEVIIREFKRKLTTSRDFLLDHCRRDEAVPRPGAGTLLCVSPDGEAAGHRM